MIISAQRKVGNKWADIAKLVPGRTDNNVKNRWNSTLMKQADPQHETKAGVLSCGLLSACVNTVDVDML